MRLWLCVSRSAGYFVIVTCLVGFPWQHLFYSERGGFLYAGFPPVMSCSVWNPRQRAWHLAFYCVAWGFPDDILL